ncbi:MAG: hypothetical protein LBI39_01675 [Puniceicoccales bacterium]|nr:hypothetical protein [Puniceicoccales bacterium]
MQSVVLCGAFGGDAFEGCLDRRIKDRDGRGAIAIFRGQCFFLKDGNGAKNFYGFGDPSAPAAEGP